MGMTIYTIIIFVFLFLIIRDIKYRNKYKEYRKKDEERYENSLKNQTEMIELLKEIRDLLKK